MPEKVLFFSIALAYGAIGVLALIMRRREPLRRWILGEKNERAFAWITILISFSMVVFSLTMLLVLGK